MCNDSIQIELSFIIPVYNSEKYISKCLDSILSQELSNYEVIIVNDGSVDNSVSIIEQYVKENHFFYLINQRNNGQGSARNAGISKAKGKYIMFIDSDDYLISDSVSCLINRMRSNDLHLLCGNYQKVDILGSKEEKSNVEKVTKYTNKIINSDDFMSEYFGFLCYTWMFVYERSFLIETGCKFLSKIYLEDMEWLSRVISKAERIMICDINFYNYVQVPNSSMRNKENQEKIAIDTLFVTNQLILFNKEYVAGKKKLWFDEMISINVIMLINFITKLSKDEFQRNGASIYKQLNSIRPKYLFIKRMPLKFKLCSFLMNLNWRCAVFFLRLINKI